MQLPTIEQSAYNLNVPTTGMNIEAAGNTGRAVASFGGVMGEIGEKLAQANKQSQISDNTMRVTGKASRDLSTLYAQMELEAAPNGMMYERNSDGSYKMDGVKKVISTKSFHEAYAEEAANYYDRVVSDAPSHSDWSDPIKKNVNAFAVEKIRTAEVETLKRRSVFSKDTVREEVVMNISHFKQLPFSASNLKENLDFMVKQTRLSIAERAARDFSVADAKALEEEMMHDYAKNVGDYAALNANDDPEAYKFLMNFVARIGGEPTEEENRILGEKAAARALDVIKNNGMADITYEGQRLLDDAALKAIGDETAAEVMSPSSNTVEIGPDGKPKQSIEAKNLAVDSVSFLQRHLKPEEATKYLEILLRKNADNKREEMQLVLDAQENLEKTVIRGFSKDDKETNDRISKQLNAVERVIPSDVVKDKMFYSLGRSMAFGAVVKELGGLTNEGFKSYIDNYDANNFLDKEFIKQQRLANTGNKMAVEYYDKFWGNAENLPKKEDVIRMYAQVQKQRRDDGGQFVLDNDPAAAGDLHSGNLEAFARRSEEARSKYGISRGLWNIFPNDFIKDKRQELKAALQQNPQEAARIMTDLQKQAKTYSPSIASAIVGVGINNDKELDDMGIEALAFYPLNSTKAREYVTDVIANREYDYKKYADQFDAETLKLNLAEIDDAIRKDPVAKVFLNDYLPVHMRDHFKKLIGAGVFRELTTSAKDGKLKSSPGAIRRGINALFNTDAMGSAADSGTVAKVTDMIVGSIVKMPKNESKKYLMVAAGVNFNVEAMEDAEDKVFSDDFYKHSGISKMFEAKAKEFNISVDEVKSQFKRHGKLMLNLNKTAYNMVYTLPGSAPQLLKDDNNYGKSGGKYFEVTPDMLGKDIKSLKPRSTSSKGSNK